MSVGKGAAAGFGGAMGVILALVLVLFVIPTIGCVGCIAIGVIGGAFDPPPEQPSDTEKVDSEEPDDDDSRILSSDESPDVSQSWPPYHPGLASRTCSCSRPETPPDGSVSDYSKA